MEGHNPIKKENTKGTLKVEFSVEHPNFVGVNTQILSNTQLKNVNMY